MSAMAQSVKFLISDLAFMITRSFKCHVPRG
jgi:hypothetical protein